MQLLLTSALLLLFTSSPVLSAAPAAQETQADSDSPAARLRSDVIRALQNGNPTEDELATLQKSLATLRAARAAKEQGQPVDRQKVESALNDAEKVFQSASFRAADRQAVQQDIQEIRRQHGK